MFEPFVLKTEDVFVAKLNQMFFRLHVRLSWGGCSCLSIYLENLKHMNLQEGFVQKPGFCFIRTSNFIGFRFSIGRASYDWFFVPFRISRVRVVPVSEVCLLATGKKARAMDRRCPTVVRSVVQGGTDSVRSSSEWCRNKRDLSDSFVCCLCVHHEKLCAVPTDF